MKYLFVLIILAIGINCSSSNKSTIPAGVHFNWDIELGDSVCTYTEIMPTFPGGEEAFYQFVRSEIHYPPIAQSAGVAGKVYVKFVVTKYGEVALPKIAQGIGYGCDEEAIRIVKLMPSWNPGKHSGIPVNIIISVPIVFKPSR